MIRITRTQTRPSTNVLMFSPIEEKAMYTVNNFVNTGVLTISHSWSEDRLVKTSIWEWLDQSTLDEYNSNHLVTMNKDLEKFYIDSKNITITETVEVI